MGRIGKGGPLRLLYPLNLFSNVPRVPQCFVQPLWVASGSKVQKCPLTFREGFYKCPARAFSLWSSKQSQRWRGDGIWEQESKPLPGFLTGFRAGIQKLESATM